VGTGYATSDFRAPIFYDSDNTAYYVDPASTSNMNVVQLLNNKWYPVNNGSGNSAEIYVRPDNNTTYVWRHIYGGTGTGFGVGVGGYGIYCEHLGGNYNLLFSPSGFVTAPYSSRAPIFYDSDDTGYYIDPNSTSNSALRMRGGALFGPNTTWGAYLAVGTNGNTNTAYCSVAATNGNLHIDAASGYGMYLNFYAGNIVNFGSGASTIVSTINPDGSHRPQIIYDYNDTSYYLDPNSTSQLSYVLANNWFRPQGNTGLYFQSYGWGIWAPEAAGNSYGNVATYGGGRIGWITDFFIWAEYRSIGAGAKVMELVEKDARDFGLKALELVTLNHNTAGQRFYTRHGFRASDDRTDYVKLLS
jgi:GNAT superfamily N-acetyltransferase